MFDVGGEIANVSLRLNLGRTLENNGSLINVPMRGTQTIMSTDVQKYLGTSALEECCAVAFVDKNQQIITLKHHAFDPGSIESAANQLEQAINDVTEQGIKSGIKEGILVLGNVRRGNRPVVVTQELSKRAEIVAERLKKEGRIKDTTWSDFNGIIIDKTTGEISDYYSKKN